MRNKQHVSGGTFSKKKTYFVIMALAAFCINPAKAEEKMDYGKALDIEQEVYTFKVEGFDENKKVRWQLEGQSANVILDKININTLKAVYYGDDMTLTLRAEKAIYDKKTQDIELRGNIVGKTSDGGELATSYARWDAKSEQIITDAYVVVKRKNIICRGRGLVTKPRLKWVAFDKDIDVDFGGSKKITCSGPFEINHDEKKAIFNNNVKVIDKESEMFTDKLTVFLNPETNEVEKVVTEGNVKIVHRGDIQDLGKIGDAGKAVF